MPKVKKYEIPFNLPLSSVTTSKDILKFKKTNLFPIVHFIKTKKRLEIFLASFCGEIGNLTGSEAEAKL